MSPMVMCCIETRKEANYMSKTILKPKAENVKLIQPIELENKKKVRYAAYVRVSSGSEEQLNSYAQQISHYVRMFREHDKEWELVDVYADEAITGTSHTKRNDFMRMITDCRLGKIDRIISKSVSRFSRDNVVTLATIRELTALGISVYFEDDRLDTMSMSTEFTLSLQGMVAEQGSKIISQNCKKSFQMRAQQGNFNQSKEPYGYDLIHKQLVVNEHKSKIVCRIFADYLNGLSMTEIARMLTDEKIASPLGKDKWYGSSVKHILTNERVIGDTLLQKKYSTETFPIQKKLNYGEKDQYYIESTHQAIIALEDFKSVQGLIEKRSKNYTPSESHSNHVFTKGIYCGECGRTLRRKFSNGIAYWSCNAKDKGDTNCSITQISEEEIYKAFIRLYQKLVVGKETILIPMAQMLTELRTTKNQSNEQLKIISIELQGLAEQSNMLNGLRAKGIIDSALCISGQTEINAKVKNLKRSREQIAMGDESDDTLIKTKMILFIVDNGATDLQKFDSIHFKSIVKEITVVSKEQLRFNLINGLELPEQIERNKRWQNKYEV